MVTPPEAGMVSPMVSWITDTEPTERFPLFTRANADEVGPDPFSPLGWSLAWLRGTGPGAADGFVTFGVVEAAELAPQHQIFANYGGYFYNALSLSRLMGVRMPGATVDAIDKAYFGNHPGVPAYEADPRDVNEPCTARLGETMAWVMSTDGFPRMDEGIERSHRVQAERPDLTTLTDSGLVDRARYVTTVIREVWHPYCEVTLAAAIGPGAVSAVCVAIGREHDAVALFGGIGGVESAGASTAIWELSRRVRESTTLTSTFDLGVDGLLRRLRGDTSGAVTAFLDDFDVLLRDFGHRGPNEWDLRSHSWTTKPELVLGMIERVRLRTDDHAPAAVASAAAAERRRLTAEIANGLEADPATRDLFLAGVRSGALFFQQREAGKSAVIRLHHEAKLALMELGRRMVTRGVLDEPQQLFFVLDAELDEFVASPESLTRAICDRERDFARLQRLQPPYIVDSRVGAPPIDEWSYREGAPADMTAGGDVLQGAAAAPGRATGRARIVLDPSSTEIEPGDVLVCATTDPSWAPLFLVASAVVCNVGAIGSHAAIVAREMGVPCAVSVVDATVRIPDRAMVLVDGTSGQVTILRTDARSPESL
jgi:phosphohistidine swiveling domain-containing protein